MRAPLSRGFTLVELIVMIVVVGILIAVAVPNFSGAQDRSRNAGVQNNLHIIQQALEEYGAEISHQYPAKLSDEFVGKQNNYLPADNYPPTPWNKQQSRDIPLNGDVLSNGYVYKCGEPCFGRIEDPDSTRSYGAIAYGIGPDGNAGLESKSQQYVLGGTGKKGVNAMRILTLKNF